MKIENFQRIRATIDQIEKHEKILLYLNDEMPVISINCNGHNGPVMTIGAFPSCEHEHAQQAMIFIDWLKGKEAKKIENLKDELIDL